MLPVRHDLVWPKDRSSPTLGLGAVVQRLESPSAKPGTSPRSTAAPTHPGGTSVVVAANECRDRAKDGKGWQRGLTVRMDVSVLI